MNIMKNKPVFILLLILITGSVYGQIDRWGVSVSNNVTSMPVTTYPQLFYSQFHPGMEFTAEEYLNKNEKNRLFLKGNLGFYYHRFIQTSVWIYPSVNYRRTLNNRLTLGTGLGFGYAVSFEDGDVFTLNDDGVYKKKSFLAGRSQFIGQFELGASYLVNKENPEGLRIHLSLKSYLQGTYVKNYVPLVPINSLQVGISLPLNCKSDEKE